MWRRRPVDVTTTDLEEKPRAALIYTLGAYDRFNYGDLLFPHVIEAAAGGSLAHLALSRSDLSNVGGVVTTPIRDIDFQAGDALLVGGGDVLTANWFGAYWHLRGASLDVLFRLAFKSLPEPYLSSIARTLFRSNWPRPFVPSAAFCSEVPVVYNAVGGSDILQLPAAQQRVLARDLAAARLVTVRDSATVRGLEKLGVRAELAPDSVAALGKDPVAEERPERRMVFQASDHWVRHRTKSLVPAIKTMQERGWEVIFLSIGQTGGHSDTSAMNRLIDLGCSLRPSEAADVQGIRAEIASASVFVGSSLHGHITAIASGTPTVALGGVSKLEAYVRTWAESIAPIAEEPSSIEDCVRAACALSTAERDDVKFRLAELARDNTVRALAATN